MHRLKNKKVFIAPCTPLTLKLKEYLQNNYDIVFLGFLDKSKSGEDIFKLNDLEKKEFDYVLVFSPNHFKSIYKDISIKIPKSKIFKIDKVKESYVLLDKTKILYEDIFLKYKSFKKESKDFFLKFFSKTIDMLNIKREMVIFISEGFIDTNIKHLYLYYIKNGKNAVLLTDNKQQLKELKQNNLPCELLGSFQSMYFMAKAKVIFLDHFILDYLHHLTKKQKVVQLWHGVGLKPIRDRSKYEYDCFISTSNWTNETNFKNVFKAKEFLNLGYPRNDVLLKKELDSLDLLLSDKKLYETILEEKNNNNKTILYMPTFRENGFDGFSLDFEKLNEVFKGLDIKFYVKLHPYVLNQYFDTIENQNEYSNVIFCKTQGDIYPILKHIDILVTDYSSIAYDFLFLNKTMIFFNYDYEEYIQAREDGIGNKFLFDYYEYTPGKKVKTQESLVEEISNLLNGNDEYKEQREKIGKLFFDYIDVNSCERIKNLNL